MSIVKRLTTLLLIPDIPELEQKGKNHYFKL